MPDFRPRDARYLYILKGTTGVYYVTSEPALADITAVAGGGLEIIRLEDCHYLGRDRQWHSPALGVLSTIQAPGTPGPPVNLPRGFLRSKL